MRDENGNGRWLIALPILGAVLAVAGTAWLRAETHTTVVAVRSGLPGIVMVENTSVVVPAERTCAGVALVTTVDEGMLLSIAPDIEPAVMIDAFRLDTVRVRIATRVDVTTEVVDGHLDLRLVERDGEWCVTRLRVRHTLPETPPVVETD